MQTINSPVAFPGKQCKFESVEFDPRRLCSKKLITIYYNMQKNKTIFELEIKFTFMAKLNFFNSQLFSLKEIGNGKYFIRKIY